jgi:hypothetical protein
VSYTIGENQLSKLRSGYRLTSDQRKPVDATVKRANSLLVLTTQNDTVHALHAFFSRRLPIWEGHVRESLAALIEEVAERKGDAVHVAKAAVAFVQNVATGFSPSAYANRLLTEVADGCRARCSKKPAALQELGRIILCQPDHKGVACFLSHLSTLM